MFEKLLSALPFTPGSVQELSFYAKRMRREVRIRQVGLVFIVFAFLIQIFAFFSPPQSTPVHSPNNLINGGFASAAGTPAHIVRRVSTTLPNIRPGDSVIIGAIVVVIASYFLFRSHLLAKESKIAITEQSGDTP